MWSPKENLSILRALVVFPYLYSDTWRDQKWDFNFKLDLLWQNWSFKIIYVVYAYLVIQGKQKLF